MALPNVYSGTVAADLTNRLDKLTSTSAPQWGKMDVAQMLAHCNVTYELTYENIHPKPNFLMRFLLKTFVKQSVVNEKPYPQNSRTAPVFVISTAKDFDKEKERLKQYINKTVELGEAHFEGKNNNGFGVLSATEWNNMFYKHLNHHFTQFGV